MEWRMLSGNVELLLLDWLMFTGEASPMMLHTLEAIVDSMPSPHTYILRYSYSDRVCLCILSVLAARISLLEFSRSPLFSAFFFSASSLFAFTHRFTVVLYDTQ